MSPSFHPPDTFFITLQGPGVSVSVLPFGLKDFPWVFFRLVSVVFASLRQSGIRIFLYLNDWLLVAYSRTLLELLLQNTLELTHRLGFLVNLEKSSLTPSQIPSFLGASLDLPRLLARPLPHRVEALQYLVQEITVHCFSPPPPQDLAGVPRSPSQFYGFDSSVQVVYAPSSTSLPEVIFSAQGQSFLSPLRLKVFVFFGVHRSFFYRASLSLPPPPSSASINVYRRVQPRMGSFSTSLPCVWPLVSPSHQLARASSSFSCPSEFRRSDLRTIDHDSIRQLLGSFLHHPSGRDSLLLPLQSHVSSVGLVSGERLSPLSLPCPRARQPAGGLQSGL